MALANGKSAIRTGELSQHAQTMIQLLKIFIPTLKLDVTEDENNKSHLIEIEGIGLAHHSEWFI